MSNMYDELSKDEQSDFDAWMTELGVMDEPTDADISQMWLESFYGRIERPFDESDVTYQRALDIRQALEQLDGLYEQGLFTDKERFANACRVLASRVDNLNYDFDSYSYHDNMDDYVTIDAARADEVRRLAQLFEQGDVGETIKFVFNLEKELNPDVQRDFYKMESNFDSGANVEVKETSNMSKVEKWSQVPLAQVIPQMIVQDEPITPEIIDMLNDRIVSEYEKLQQGYGNVKDAWEDAQYRLYVVSTGRDEEGFDANDPSIPWYLEQKLGTSATVDELTDEMNEKEQNMESYHDDYIKPFFKDVYDLQHYNFDGVGAHITGVRGDGSKDTPVLIASHTVKALGPDYESFAKDYFHEQLEAIKNRNIGKKGLFGIDVSKSANGVVTPQSETQSVVKQNVVDYTLAKDESIQVTEEMQVDDGKEVVQRQLPCGFEVHNTATAEDDNSFDDFDGSDDDKDICE